MTTTLSSYIRMVISSIVINGDDKLFVLNPVVGHVMDGLTPYRYLRAVLNAFPQGYVEIRNGEGIINDLDYTKGDLAKDLGK